MSSLSELVREQADLSRDEIEHLHALLESWELLADLAFADLQLWCPLRSDEEADAGFVCIGQMRPHTAQTLHPEDSVGRVIRTQELPVIDRAFDEGRRWQQDEPVLIDGLQIRMEAVPVPFGGRVIAALAIQGAPLVHRRPGRLEESYLECADYLSSMIENGLFPFQGDTLDPGRAPRVGDGLMRVDVEGKVLYASPNAMSAFRRLGSTAEVVGQSVSQLGVDSPANQALRRGMPAEIETASGETVIQQRAIPFLDANKQVLGVMILVRDVTELRHRERLLQRKDEAIREIHHRVKNNLQTIASLLRIQARRLSSDEARIELEQAVRRINSIAIVHETLTQETGESVQFDRVAKELASMVATGLTDPERQVSVSVRGDLGSLPPEQATPLAVAAVELMQNAVEHAFDGGGGRIDIDLSRDEVQMHLVVTDDGRGLPAGFDEAGWGLGLQIVNALVTEQLGGTISLHSNGGTQVNLDFPIRTRQGLRPN